MSEKKNKKREKIKEKGVVFDWVGKRVAMVRNIRSRLRVFSLLLFLLI